MISFSCKSNTKFNILPDIKRNPDIRSTPIKSEMLQPLSNFILFYFNYKILRGNISIENKIFLILEPISGPYPATTKLLRSSQSKVFFHTMNLYHNFLLGRIRTRSMYSNLRFLREFSVALTLVSVDPESVVTTIY